MIRIRSNRTNRRSPVATNCNDNGEFSSKLMGGTKNFRGRCITAFKMLVYALIAACLVNIVPSTVLGPLLRHPPKLEPLPANPRKASATLYTDSNPCYDMALLVFLDTWRHTNSSYPMLVLHSIDLPEKVVDYIGNSNGMIKPVPVPERRSYFVIQTRWRKSATRFSVWDQTDYDLINFYDADHIFDKYSNDNAFDVFDPTTTETLLYAYKDLKRPNNEFNAGYILLRPSQELSNYLSFWYNWRIFVMSGVDAACSGDQRYLNAALAGHWEEYPTKRLVKHAKIWKWAAFNEHNQTKDGIRGNQLVEQMGLQPELQACMSSTIAYSLYNVNEAKQFANHRFSGDQGSLRSARQS